MATSVTITPFIQIGVVDLAFTIANQPSGTSVSRITTLTNEIGVGTSITETDHPVKDSTGNQVTKVSLSSELAPAGKTLFAVLSVYFSDGSVVSSDPKVLTPIGIPLAPSPAVSFFTELDKGLSMNLGSMYSRMGSTDGYSAITNAIVYISKVGGTVAGDFRTINVPIDGASPVVNGVPTGIDGYSKTYVVADDLENGVDYEVAFRVKNNLGVSPISKTHVLRPKDFPAVLTPARVHTLLGEQTRTGTALDDLRGDVLVYFSLPSDNEQLKATAPVQRYIVTETDTNGASTTYTLPVTQTATTGANAVSAGTPITSGLPSNISFERATFAQGDSYKGVYDYKLTIFGSTERLGVKNTYSVVAENKNGKGPDSPVAVDGTSAVIPFLLPSAQPFFVDHETVPGSTVNGGLAYVVHTGKIVLRITSLSAVNSGSDMRVDRDGITGLDCQLKLQVATAAAPTSFIFNNTVTFKQGVNTETTGSVGNQVTTKTPTGVYTLNFDDVSLNSILVSGTKYVFTLIRLTKNPNTMATILSSLPTSISRTKFFSPAKSNFCESYSFDENFNPVTTLTGKKAIQMLFGRLEDSVLSACGLTSAITGTGDSLSATPAINYLAFQQSQPVFVDTNGDMSNAADKKQLSVSHYPIRTQPYSLIIPASNYGAAMVNYLRIQLYNSELGQYINASESFPAVTEAALTYVSAPTQVNVDKLTETSIKVSYTLQSGSALNGNSSANVKNRVLLLDDSTNAVVHESVMPYSAGTPYVTISGLTTSKLYRVHVIAESYYNRRTPFSGSTDAQTGVFTPNDSVLRFDNIVVRDPSASVATQILEMTGKPTAPQAIEFFASDKQVTAYWDAPAFDYGVKNLKYHFFSALKSISFATESTLDISGTSSVVINRAATVSTQTRALMPELVNGTIYKMAVAVAGTVGGLSVVNDSFTHNYSDGKIAGVSKQNSLLLTTTQKTIPESTVQGDMSASFDVMPAANVVAPNLVSVMSKSGGMIQVTFNKRTDIGDVLISVNTNDALNNSNGPVLAFDSRFARTLSTVGGVTSVVTGGIWNIENGYNNLSQTLKDAYAPFSFEKKTENGTDNYTVNFVGLKNAVVYTFELRHIINTSGNDVFSEVVTGTGSPEAAPTTITNPSFSVNANQITASFSPPLSKGSATARLQYIVAFLDTTTNSTNTAQTIMSDLNETSETRYVSVISGLVNGRAYRVNVTAFYTKADGSQVTGDPSPINTLSGSNGNIVPRAAPVGPTMATTAGDNTLTAVVTSASTTERTNYRISALNLYVALSSAPNARTLVKGWSQAEYSASSTLTQPILSFPSGFVHSKPLNGVSYDLTLEAVPDYTDAQPIPGTSNTGVMPSGNVRITSTSVNNRQLTVSGLLNGSGAITSIVSLVKPTGSSNVVVKNLTGGSLPTISVTGAVDNTTNFVGANQQFSFILNYTNDITSAIEHHLSVVVTPNSSDAGLNSSSFFA